MARIATCVMYTMPLPPIALTSQAGIQLMRSSVWPSGKGISTLTFFRPLKAVGIYPIGSLVRLESNRLAVVLEQREQLLMSRKEVFYSVTRNAYIPIEIVDLLAPKGYGRIMSRESPKVWGFHHWIIFGALTW
ncbi:hypothetical protein [Pseudomonas luteola]|uniref:hypothetical protein n=1 Tax=Pseudomonas luteola TaxID=47886 RepID=UPI002E22DCC0